MSYYSTLSACILLMHRVPVSIMQALAAFKRARECNPANAEAEAKLISASSTGTGDAAPKPMAGGAFLCPSLKTNADTHRSRPAHAKVPMLCSSKQVDEHGAEAVP